MTSPLWTKSIFVKFIVCLAICLVAGLCSFLIYNRLASSSSSSSTITATASSADESDNSPIDNYAEIPNALKNSVDSWIKDNINTSTSHEVEDLSQKLTQTSDLHNFTEIDIVKPIKLHVETIHEEDLLYESKKDGTHNIGKNNKFPHHKTGHYRSKSSQIWDPHPEYEINALGYHLHLKLNHDDEFIQHDIQVTHVWPNETLRKRYDRKDEGCFYRGKVVDDDKSVVAVSLCEGMRGHIRTKSGSFFIQPIEKYTNEHTNIQHAFFRIPSKYATNMNGNMISIDDSNCDLDTNIQDNDNDVIDNNNQDDQIHTRNKRSIQSYHYQNQYNQRQSHRHQRHNQQQHQQQQQHHYPHHQSGSNSQRNVNNYRHNSNSNQNYNNNDNREYDPYNDYHKKYQQMQQVSLDNDEYHYQVYQQHQQKQLTFVGNPTREYTIEVLVAVDRKMREYHGDMLQSYVLTLMSIVSNIYADASIGNSIKIAVVHIMHIEHDLVPMETSSGSGNGGVSAPSMLIEFCRLKKTHNFPHDTALLLTREQICRNPSQMKCDTLGLAELGTMCKPHSCAIVQDNGLSAAFTIAHELGHVLNMPHDDDNKCSEFRGSQSKQNIMSRMLDHNTHPWSWSNCSRHFVTEFLERKDDKNCLLDKPQRDMIEKTTADATLAGEKFSADQQCALVFGEGAKICSYMPECSRLWCSEGEQEVEGCRTQHMPWADGTKCAKSDGYWCQKGECVPKDRKVLLKIDGGWGPWGTYGECSQTCGGGVKFSIRQCNNPSPVNGGKICTGKRIQYQSCNTQDCPDDSSDLRGEQCSAFNNNNFNLAGVSDNVKWVPKYGLDKNEQCKLYCRIEGTGSYYQLANKVIDGTPCTYWSFNKCVDGACIQAGCDNVLGSSAELDMCGVCKGKNETCESHYGNLTHSLFNEKVYYKHGYYYYSVVTIPKGATNIEIIQPGYENDENFIALKNDQGEYILNNIHHRIEHHHRIIHYGGVSIEYNGGNQINEKINTTYARQLKRALVVEILSFKRMDPIDENIIKYSYSNSNPDRQLTINSIYYYPNYPKKHFSWTMKDWTECSSLCSGKRFRKAICVEINSNTPVAESHCRTSAKPIDDTEECNTNCKFNWEIIKSNCSATCAEGVRTIKYECTQKYSTNHENSKVVDSKHCSLPMKQVEYEPCMGSCNEVQWTYSEWGHCSKTCGDGKQSRSPICLSHPNGYIVEDKYCAHLPKQETLRFCNRNVSCPEWEYGDETPCSVTCGNGQRKKVLLCKQNNMLVNPSFCGTRPVDIIINCTLPACETNKNIQPYDEHFDNNKIRFIAHPSSEDESKNISLNMIDTSKYEWRTGRWGECSVTCGNGGKKVRSVRCVNIQSGDQEFVDDLYCNQAMRPINVTNCNEFRCPQWNFGLWSECANDCKRYRQVECQDHRGKKSDQCPLDMEPPNKDTCCQFKWKTYWKPCNVSCGRGYRLREYACTRIFPRSPDNPHPIKNGKKVDPKYCSHLQLPKYTKMKKECNRPCDFKWEVSQWSKCSVGCGKGNQTRSVVCGNGKIVSPSQRECQDKNKPADVRICESRSHCRWKPHRWRNCTCLGHQKRKVICLDTLTHKHGTLCNHREKPLTRQQCNPPPNCSCRAIQQYRKTHVDGEYLLNLRGRKISIYCHNMSTSHPLEYLTLKKGIMENYSLYYNKRSMDMAVCGYLINKEMVDESIPYGTTRFSKVRLNINNLQVIENDFTFASTIGKAQSFASAGDCYSSTEKCPQGDFSVNLEGTGFRIRPSNKWDVKGQNATMDLLIDFNKEPTRSRVRARCGGYCGRCQPSRAGFHLDLL